MGIIKAAVGAIGGGLADSWLEVLEADNMSDTTVFTGAVAVRKDDKRSSNKKSSAATISNGSIIMVAQNQFMLLTEGGKVVDYTAEPGSFKVDNSAMPSLFNGQFLDSLKETFSRVKYGGVPSSAQRAYFINLQEIKNIAFGTVNPINYFDNFYNAELFLRTNGYFSIRIVEPLKFFAEAIPRNSEHVDIEDIHKLYLAEFLTALQTAINQMSVDGIRISHVTSKSMELAKYLADVLDDEWTERRGMKVESVGLNSISYDEESKKLINMRNTGAMLSDPGVREGYVQGSVARGVEAAGSNAAGSMAGFMGVGLGMQQGGNLVGAASASNQAQMQQNQTTSQPSAADGWTCASGHKASGKFCPECGAARPSAWTCACGQSNSGKFCSSCGQAKPSDWTCACGQKNSGKFCSNCGKPQA